ncbi:hypothetical protein [Palleronia rufa]|uniref:hypothetical protein n=1 Tax=Palleronia rufa TaxID=1530186 RepID=UPI00056D4F63|nr:hypothetical protein [Palleronia rufa]
MPLAAAICLARQYRAVRLDLIAKGLEADEGQDPKPTAARSLSDFMAFEGYPLPEEWAPQLNQFWHEAADGAFNSDNLLRVGPQDVGSIILEMAEVYENGASDALEAVREFATFRLTVAAFELHVLTKTDLGAKVCEMPLPKLAREASCMKDVSFAERRRVVLEVTQRLRYELEEMKIERTEVYEEAGCRLFFFKAVHTWVESEEFPPQ